MSERIITSTNYLAICKEIWTIMSTTNELIRYRCINASKRTVENVKVAYSLTNTRIINS